MGSYILERSQVVDRSGAETFAFFCDAHNLERITPAFLRFRILTPQPIHMGTGTLIDYQLSLLGIPFGWQTRILEWVPEHSFVDEQVKGPYALWRHTHTFEALGPDRTLMRDRVEYRLPLGILGRIAHALWVKRTLRGIFDYRAATTAQLFRSSTASRTGAVAL
ncbi:MAG: SRPBCC family protein [Blastocatellia bacterium]